MQALLDKYLDGTLTREEARLVDAWIRESEANARVCAQVFLQHYLTREYMVGTSINRLLMESEHDPAATHGGDEAAEDGSALLAEVLELEFAARQARQRQVELRPKQVTSVDTLGRLDLLCPQDEPVVPVRHIVIPRWTLYLSIGALAALLLLLVSSHGTGHLQQAPVQQPTPPTQTPVRTPVAYLGHVTGGRVNAASASGKGDPLHAGQMVELDGGLAEIIFERQARLIVQGPARLIVRSDNAIELLAGRIVASCPSTAHEFTVQVDSMRVIDLGTEFGVAFADPEGILVQVYDGTVEVDSRSSADSANDEPVPTRSLHAGEAAWIDESGNYRPVPFNELAFVRVREFEAYLQAKAGSAYHQWLAQSHRLRRDHHVLLYYTFDQSEDARYVRNLAATGSAMDGIVDGAEQVSGRFAESTALQFGQTGSTVRFSVPNKLEAVTIGGWFRLDDVPYLIGQIVASEDWYRPGALHWNIYQDGSLGLEKSMGVNGSGKHNQRLTASFPFEHYAGKWVHLVGVCDTRRGIVQLYIDGQLAAERELLDTSPIQLDQTLLGNWYGETLPRQFVGRIDELVIFDRALTAGEIADLVADQWVFPSSP